LFTGDAGQGESNIRRWIIENDWLETIVALPLNLFYNTGIATYVWVLTNRKPEARRGKVQLIDATHSYLKGDALAAAIQADHLQWDPSVLGLLPFPSVLDMMARDQAWTEQLGNAVLNQRSDVMDAVQRMRRQARDYGYLAPNAYVNVVDSGGYIQVLPLNPGVIYVPWYDPYVVFAPPRPGVVVATAIHFGPAITIGATFGTWGWWIGSGFVWPTHTILIDHRPWVRVWGNHFGYIHPYVHPWVRPARPRVEVHHRGR
jgi:hypothetical protein